jgi:hypothetical protein
MHLSAAYPPPSQPVRDIVGFFMRSYAVRSLFVVSSGNSEHNTNTIRTHTEGIPWKFLIGPERKQKFKIKVRIHCPGKNPIFQKPQAGAGAPVIHINTAADKKSPRKKYF